MAQLEAKTVRWLVWVLLGAPFPAMGALTGWLVGLSESPVVASLLPLIFGLFGGLGYGLLGKRTSEQRLREKLAGLDQAMREAVETVLTTRARPLEMPVLWSIGVVLFCAACAVGVHFGLNARMPVYGPISQWVDVGKLQPSEGALLYGLRWKLQTAGVTDAEAAEFFGKVIKPVLALADEQTRLSRLIDIVDAIEPADGRRFIAAVEEDPNIPDASGDGPPAAADWLQRLGSFEPAPEHIS